MKVSVFAVENVLSGTHTGLYLYRSDAMASRQLMIVAQRSNPDLDISELRLKRVGYFDDETCEYESCKPTLISWNERGRIEGLSESVPVEKAERDFEQIV